MSATKNKISHQRLISYQRLISVVISVLSAVVIASNAQAATIQRAPNNLGLVGYWSFNEATGTKATDMSGNGNTGTLTGANGLPTWTGGRLGSALNFDGVDDYVSSPYAPSTLAAFSTSFWVKFDNFNDTYNGILAQQISSSPQAGGWTWYCNSSGLFIIYARSNGVNFLGSSGESTGWTPSTNIWYHVATTWDSTGDGKVRFYVNGSLTYTSVGTSSSAMTSVPKLMMGSLQWSDSNQNAIFSDQQLHGLIDEVRVYNRALTATEIANLYKTGLSQVNPSAQNKKLTSGLVGLWSFNGADMNWANSMAYDRSGQGNHGTLTGANGLPKIAIGQQGQALSFDGVDDYVDAGSVSSYSFVQNTLIYSFSFWMRVYSPTTRQAIMGNTASEVEKGFFAILENGVGVGTKAIRIAILKGTPGISVIDARTPDNVINDTNWHYITIVSASAANDTTIYVDGVAKTPTTYTSSFSALSSGDSSETLFVGATHYGTPQLPLSGSLDDVRIYNRALSVSEIGQLYRAGGARLKPDKPQVNLMKDSSLVGFWTFNGQDISNTANLAYDRSGPPAGGNNGTMTNMATSSRYAIGISGQALSFDGVDDYVRSPNTTFATDTYAVFAWVKPAISTSNVMTVWNIGGLNDYMYDNALIVYSSTVGMVGYHCQGVLTLSGITIPTGAWSFIGYSRTGSTVNFFVNGSMMSTAINYPQIPSSGNPFLIGVAAINTSLFYYWNGLIDEVRVYNRALSADEIGKLYRATRHQ